MRKGRTSRHSESGEGSGENKKEMNANIEISGDIGNVIRSLEKTENCSEHYILRWTLKNNKFVCLASPNSYLLRHSATDYLGDHKSYLFANVKL